jgi:hypothetical protein
MQAAAGLAQWACQENADEVVATRSQNRAGIESFRLLYQHDSIHSSPLQVGG